LPLVLAALVALAGAPVAAEGVSGPYLAGRLAMSHFDYAAASEAFTRALISDPSNPQFLENAVIARIGIGDVDKALPIAAELDRLGIVSQAAAMIDIAGFARDEAYDKALAAFDTGLSAGKLVDGLDRAWALVGLGRMSDATEAFDKVAAIEGLKPFASYHKALALASVGDFEGAEAIFASGDAGPLGTARRGIVAQAQVLGQLDRQKDALALLDQGFGPDPDPQVARLREDLAAGRPVAFTVVRGAQDGMAEVYFNLAAAMLTDTPEPYALAYARLASWIRPDHIDAILLTAQILEAQKQYDLATEAYNAVPREDPAYYVAELGRAAELILGDRTDAAIEALTNLSKSFPDLPRVWISLGDALRRVERYGEAAKAYDKAIALFPGDSPNQWPVYYARGIANERENNWPAAEADFRKALALSPEQPQVLNYLGYSFVEKGENLDEALGMIERAVKAEPDSGYIVDSLGWGLYRLGRYAEALGHMEKAVALMPVDSVVNDHLGDVYWAVGRRLEAEFQWRRALSFAPEPGAAADGQTDDEAAKAAARIRRKLEVGLDTVLKEEGAPPLSVTANGG
jgi:tetratricopeptide (TPR) repeat protein